MNAEREDLTMDERAGPIDGQDAAEATRSGASTLPPPPDDADDRSPGGATEDHAAEGGSSTRERAPLLAEDRASSFRSRWEAIQVRFVDEPRTSVEEADRLVTEVIEQLQASFTSERGRLEAEWQQGGEVSTENLRVALQRYRSFFDRLLAA